jgi:hypothetical protein
MYIYTDGLLYDYVTNDVGVQDSEYEYPENVHHLYEYPFLGNEQGATDRTEDSGYTSLVRPPNESEDNGYTSLIGALGGKGDTDGIPNDDDVIDGHYTSLARRPLNDDETEAPRYQPLMKNQKTSEEGGVTGTKDEAEELSCVDVINDDYTPLARRPSKDDEMEAPRYQHLIKDKNTSEKGTKEGAE